MINAKRITGIFGSGQSIALTMTLILLTVSATLAQAQQVVNTEGLVRDESGLPVADAYVFLLSGGPELLALGKIPQQWSGRTGTDGSFQIRDVPNGVYKYCVHPTQSDFISTCLWGSEEGASEVTVESGQLAGDTAMTLRKGLRTRVRLVDPTDQILLNEPADDSREHILVGVFTAARQFVPANLVAVGPSEKIYEIVLPFEIPVNITAASGYYKLANEAGESLNNGQNASTPVTIAKGTRDKVVTLHITGVSGR